MNECYHYDLKNGSFDKRDNMRMTSYQGGMVLLNSRLFYVGGACVGKICLEDGRKSGSYWYYNTVTSIGGQSDDIWKRESFSLPGYMWR